GKSRLTAALLETLAPERHTRLRYFCSPQHTDSAFYPIIGQMERAAGLLHDDTSRRKLDKLDALLSQTSTTIQAAALIAEMRSLPNDCRYPALAGTRLLSASMRHDIIERTDGIPLFVEEMTKAVLEAGSETAAARAIAAVPSPALAVPASLHASLM